jgi:hypothetical protein
VLQHKRMVGLGSQADSQRSLPNLEHLPLAHIARQRLQREPTQLPARRLSCLQRSRLLLVATLFKAAPLPLARFMPEP